MLHVRRYHESDWPALWPILHATVRSGNTYTFAPESSEAELHQAWVEVPTATFVCCDVAEKIVGTYFIKPNHPGLGAHVGNCGYMVATSARGQGVAACMCEHSQAQALALGFRALQFNFVVATNEPAVRLWQKMGFVVVGRLPGAFHHQRLGYVDALVMFKTLVD